MKRENENMIFSTLFDSNYLDKGMLLIRSLQNVMKDFHLYVFAFDDICYDVIKKMNCEQVIPITLKEFESPELLIAKRNRTGQEYCWTCSCHTIKFVLEHFKEKHCTYIDADMYFYNSPEILWKEIIDSQCDVSIIEHRMPNNIENRRTLSMSGKYCIEFNTFFNNKNGMYILDWWCERCLECCTAIPDSEHFGDQKYLNDWLQRFSKVHVIEHAGAGVAPWNIAKYRISSHNGQMLRYRFRKKEFPLIFYHFQSMYYISKNVVDIRVNIYPNKAQKILYDNLYKNYLTRIDEVRKELFNMYEINLYDKQTYYSVFNRKQFFKDDILKERNILVILSKIWRVLFRKKNDYIVW